MGKKEKRNLKLEGEIYESLFGGSSASKDVYEEESRYTFEERSYRPSSSYSRGRGRGRGGRGRYRGALGHSSFSHRDVSSRTEESEAKKVSTLEKPSSGNIFETLADAVEPPRFGSASSLSLGSEARKKSTTTEVQRFAHPGRLERNEARRKNRQELFKQPDFNADVEECTAFYLGKCERQDCPRFHNYAKRDAGANNRKFSKTLQAFHKLLNIVEKNAIKSGQIEQIKQVKELDMMFVMDCTGSMGSWITAAKKSVNAIIDTVLDDHPDATVRISFVVYRDFGDANRIDVCKFTEDVEEVRGFIAKQSAYGGGDGPEDVCGGLRAALKQDWQSPSKYLVFVADAPAHGKRYHNDGYDDYPGGDPKGSTVEELIQRIAEMDITLTAFKMNSYTDKMFEIMSDVYNRHSEQDMEFADLTDGNNSGVDVDEIFREFVAGTASATLGSDSIGSAMQYDFPKIFTELATCSASDDSLAECFKQLKLTLSSHGMSSLGDQFSMIDAESKTDMSASLIATSEAKESKTSSDSFEIIAGESKGETTTKSAAPESFEKVDVGKGSCDDASVVDKDYELSFMLKGGAPRWGNLNGQRHKAICHTWYIKKDMNSLIDWRNPHIIETQFNTDVIIAQEPFSAGAMRYAFYMKDLSFSNEMSHMVAKLPIKINKLYTIEQMRKEIEMVLLCQQIVNVFNDRLVNKANESLLMNFVQCFVYELQTAGVKEKLYAVENHITGAYEKFSNNAGWEKRSRRAKVLIAHALSHFSWQYTQGYLMITDLQGVGSTLTDPQIHCQDAHRFGSGNLGYIGMTKFFVNHECNTYCKELNLVNPMKTAQIPDEFVFFGEILLKPPSFNATTIKKLCDICREPYAVPRTEYYKKRVRGGEFYCFPCEKERKGSMTKMECAWCSKEYRCSAYYYKMKRSELPDKCFDCRLKERIQDREKLAALSAAA